MEAASPARGLSSTVHPGTPIIQDEHSAIMFAWLRLNQSEVPGNVFFSPQRNRRNRTNSTESGPGKNSNGVPALIEFGPQEDAQSRLVRRIRAIRREHEKGSAERHGKSYVQMIQNRGSASEDDNSDFNTHIRNDSDSESEGEFAHLEALRQQYAQQQSKHAGRRSRKQRNHASNSNISSGYSGESSNPIPVNATRVSQLRQMHIQQANESHASSRNRPQLQQQQSQLQRPASATSATNGYVSRFHNPGHPEASEGTTEPSATTRRQPAPQRDARMVSLSERILGNLAATSPGKRNRSPGPPLGPFALQNQSSNINQQQQQHPSFSARASMPVIPSMSSGLSPLQQMIASLNAQDLRERRGMTTQPSKNPSQTMPQIKRGDFSPVRRSANARINSNKKSSTSGSSARPPSAHPSSARPASARVASGNVLRPRPPSEPRKSAAATATATSTTGGSAASSAPRENSGSNNNNNNINGPDTVSRGRTAKAKHGHSQSSSQRPQSAAPVRQRSASRVVRVGESPTRAISRSFFELEEEENYDGGVDFTDHFAVTAAETHNSSDATIPRLCVIGGLGFLSPPTQHRYWSNVIMQVGAYSGHLAAREQVEAVYSEISTFRLQKRRIANLHLGNLAWSEARATPETYALLGRHGFSLTRISSNPRSARFLAFGGQTATGKMSRQTSIVSFAPGGVASQLLDDTSKAYPPRRAYHTACFCSQRNSVIVFGGRSATAFFDDVWEWMLETGTWRRLSTHRDVPGARSGHTAVYLADVNQIVVFGGEGSLGVAGDLNFLDMGSLTWTRITTPPDAVLPDARSGHSAVLVGHNMYIFGGRDWQGNLRNDLFVLDTKSLQWKEITFGPSRIGSENFPANNPPQQQQQAVVPPVREMHGCTVHGSLMYICGGWGGDVPWNKIAHPWLSDTWVVNLNSREPAMWKRIEARQPANASGASNNSNGNNNHQSSGSANNSNNNSNHTTSPCFYGHHLVYLDYNPVDADRSTFSLPETILAGRSVNITIEARTARSEPRLFGGDMFEARISLLPPPHVPVEVGGIMRPRSAKSRSSSISSSTTATTTTTTTNNTTLTGSTPAPRHTDDPADEPLVPIRVIKTVTSSDLNNGMHLIKFTAPPVGRYLLEMFYVDPYGLEGRLLSRIAGSPAVFSVTPDVLSAAHSEVCFALAPNGVRVEEVPLGSGNQSDGANGHGNKQQLHLMQQSLLGAPKATVFISVGERVLIPIIARDRFGNRITGSENRVKQSDIEVHTSSTLVCHSRITFVGNDPYVELLAESESVFLAAVTSNGEPLLGSPFYVDAKYGDSHFYLLYLAPDSAESLDLVNRLEGTSLGLGGVADGFAVAQYFLQGAYQQQQDYVEQQRGVSSFAAVPESVARFSDRDPVSPVNLSKRLSSFVPNLPPTPVPLSHASATNQSATTTGTTGAAAGGDPSGDPISGGASSGINHAPSGGMHPSISPPHRRPKSAGVHSSRDMDGHPQRPLRPSTAGAAPRRSALRRSSDTTTRSSSSHNVVFQFSKEHPYHDDDDDDDDDEEFNASISSSSIDDAEREMEKELQRKEREAASAEIRASDRTLSPIAVPGDV